MKRIFILLIPLLVLVFTPALRADASVAISIGEPGFYGTLVIGDHYPPPVLVYSEPILIDHVHGHGPPLYMHVPPGHAKHWEKHCTHYGACGHPVYFVQDSWYNNVYVPTYHEHHGKKGKGKHKGNGHH